MPSFIWSMDAQSWMSCVVAPQWMYLACSVETIFVICSTRGSTGYPTISVSMASFSKLCAICQQPLIDASIQWTNALDLGHIATCRNGCRSFVRHDTSFSLCSRQRDLHIDHPRDIHLVRKQLSGFFGPKQVAEDSRVDGGGVHVGC